jgi:hypothetical protein
MMQAMRRSWRIGQTKPVDIYFFCYKGTAQETCLSLMAQKVKVSQSTSGEMPSSGLDILNQEADNLEIAIAKKLINGESFDEPEQEQEDVNTEFETVIYDTDPNTENIYKDQIKFQLRYYDDGNRLYKGMFNVLYTPKTKYLADRLNCYWLLTDIDIFLKEAQKVQTGDVYNVIFKDCGKSKSFGRSGVLIYQTSAGDEIYRHNYSACDLYAEIDLHLSLLRYEDPESNVKFILSLDDDYEYDVSYEPNDLE